MPRVLLRPEILDLCDPGAPADRWLARLHEAGLLADLGELSEPEALAIRSLRADVARLRMLEDRIQLARQPIPWLVGEVNPAVGGIFVLTGLGCWIVGKFVWEDAAVLFGMAATPVVLGVYAIVGLAWSVRMELRRRTALDRALVDRRACGEQLLAAITDILTAPFVLEGPGTTLVSAPQRHWLNLRLRDLRVAGVGRDLSNRMGEALDRVETALRTGALDGLEVDLRPFAVEFAQLGVRPGGAEGARFDRGIGGPVSP